MRNLFSVLGLVGALAATPVLAADLVALGWGEFRPSEENAITAKDIAFAAGPADLSLVITLAPLTADAQGAATEGTARYAGEASVQQPDYTKLPVMRVTLSGQIVKTAGSSAEITVVIGTLTKTVSWPVEAALAEQFSTVIDAELPNGEVPQPFPVEATVTVKKSATGGAALVSLDKIDIRISQQRVAEAAP